MLKRPRHLPVYVASYLDSDGKLTSKAVSIISRISKPTKNKLANYTNTIWGDICIDSISFHDLNNENLPTNALRTLLKRVDCPSNTIGMHDAKLVSKDVWIKAVKKANKLIDEKNKKEGTRIKRISY